MAKLSLNDLVSRIRELIPEGCSLVIDHSRVLTVGTPKEEPPKKEEPPAKEDPDDIDLGEPPPEEGADGAGDSGTEEAAPEEPEAEEGAEEEGDFWKPEERCQVEIDGNKYPGTVKEVNDETEKVFVVFDDGDEAWYAADALETLEPEETGGDDDKGSFGLEALGLPAKIHEKLEAEGYATVGEVQEALDDGTLEELKSIPKAALSSIKKSVKSFATK